MVHDITERKRAELALENSEKQLRFVLQGSGLGFWDWDIAAGKVERNARWAEMLGYTYSEIQQTTRQWTDFIHPDDRDRAWGSIHAVLEGRSNIHRIEYRMLHRDGGIRWILDQASVMQRDTHGKPARMCGTHTDITGIKHAEEVLRNSEARFHSLYDTMTEGVALHQLVRDATGQPVNYVILDANPAFERHTGLRVQDVIGKTASQAYGRVPYFKQYAQVATSGQPSQFETYYSPLGKTFSISVVSPGPDQFATIFRDISEKVQSEKALRESRAQLEAIFDLAPIGIATVRIDGACVMVNRALTRIFGYTIEEEMLGVSWQSATHPDDIAEDERLIQDLLNHKIPYYTREKRFIKKNGAIVWATLGVALILKPDGTPDYFVCVVEDITGRKQTEEKIEFLAYHDALTGLSNRLLLEDRVRQSMALADRTQSKVALIFFDLDNFKTINDSLGHLIGDQLIKMIGQRLLECVRDTDTISRQGGDEFLIMLPELQNIDAIAPVLDKLMIRLAEPCLIEGHELATSASMGVSIFPDDGTNFDTLLKKADMAMYRAKEAGRNTYRFFDHQMNSEAVEQLQLRSGLRRALVQNELVLHYQPQLDIASGALLGAEALIRWQHPELGMVPPGRFIPIAEDSGLIVPIGAWVLREACRQAASWRRAGMRDLVVAVNLSAIQFKRGDIEQSVIAALQESDLPASLLELELTESILIHDTEKTLAAVQRLKRLGVKLSIDDFGTGYSSLSYLKRFQVDKIKIDQSFTRNLASDGENEAIVRAVVQMADSLGLTTIAEGVEDESTLIRLSEIGCDEAQGYFFARPMPIEDFNAFRLAFGVKSASSAC